MANRNQSSSSNLVIVLLLILTFPIWIGIFGALFGIGIGFFGAIAGIFAAVFGIFIAIITIPFKIFFGDGWWFDNDGFSLFGNHGLALIVFVVLVAFLVRRRDHANSK